MQFLTLFHEFYLFGCSESYYGTSKQEDCKKTEILSIHSSEYVVFCVHIIPSSHNSVVPFSCLFWKCVEMVIKINQNSKFTPSNVTLSTFTILVLVIHILNGKLELATRWHFLAFDTRSFAENQKMRFFEAPCRLALFLKIMCKDCYYLHIRKNEYFLEFWKTYHRYKYWIKVVLELTLVKQLKKKFPMN